MLKLKRNIRLKSFRQKTDDAVAVFSFTLGLLLVITAVYKLAFNTSYQFLAINGLIAGLIGIAASLSWFKNQRWFKFLSYWFCICGFIFVLSSFLFESKLFVTKVLLILSMFWLVEFILLKIIYKPKKIKVLKLIDSKRQYVVLLITITVIVWLFPLENIFSIVRMPNQNGSKYYSDSNYQIDIRGGFIYRVELLPTGHPAEVIIKQIAPETTVHVNSKEAGSLKLNILNSSYDSQVSLNGQKLSKNFYAEGRQLANAINTGKSIEKEVLYSKDYTAAKKGFWLEADFKAGDNNLLIKPAESDDMLHFIFLSDLHSGYHLSFKEIWKIIETQPDFMIWGGDIVNYGIHPEYVVASSFSEMIPVPIYTTVGNHEDWQDGIKFYQSYYGPLTNSFTYKNCLFVFLDNSSGSIESKQFDWLKLTLAASQAKYKLIIAHMPPIDPATGKFDDNQYRYEEMRQNMFDKDESAQLLDIAREFKVDAILSGHTHQAAEYNYMSVRLITSGALGGLTLKGDTVGYIEVTADDNGIGFKNIPVFNQMSAKSEFAEKLEYIRLFSGPFLLDKAIRLNVTLVLIIIYTYMLKKELDRKIQPKKFRK